MLKTWWKIVVTAVWVIGGLLSFFFFIEVLRAYQTLHNFHPAAAYLFVIVLACLTILVFWYFFAALVSRPPVLIPPPIGDPAKASALGLRRYARYLARYLNRLRNNNGLCEHDRRIAAEAVTALNAARKNWLDREKLLAAITLAEDTAVKPLLEKIDARALCQVRASMRDVMVGVTLSPYKAADLLIVLYRNLVMITRIIHVYNARPRFRQQLSIYADIIRVIATVNYINMGKNLIEGLGSNVPGIGRFVDDIAQGMGAGFMTTVVGHAAMDRCRAFRTWNERQAKDSLRNRAADFYGDVKDTFWVDVWPAIRSRAGAAAVDLKDKIAAALDETGEAISSFIKAPVNAAVCAGNAAGKAAGKAATSSFRGIIGIPGAFRRKKAPAEDREH